MIRVVAASVSLLIASALMPGISAVAQSVDSTEREVIRAVMEHGRKAVSSDDIVLAAGDSVAPERIRGLALSLKEEFRPSPESIISCQTGSRCRATSRYRGAAVIEMLKVGEGVATVDVSLYRLVGDGPPPVEWRLERLDLVRTEAGWRVERVKLLAQS